MRTSEFSETISDGGKPAKQDPPERANVLFEGTLKVEPSVAAGATMAVTTKLACDASGAMGPKSLHVPGGCSASSKGLVERHSREHHLTHGAKAETKMSDHRRPKIVRLVPAQDHCVVEYCRKSGVTLAEQKKLLALLGKRAALHELRSNSPPRAPRFR